MRNLNTQVFFISPRKTCALDAHGYPVQKLRCSVSLPALTILGALENAGFETDFLDLAADGWEHQEVLNSSAIQYGLSTEDAIDLIAQRNPKFVLITSMFTFEQMVVDELVCSIKKAFPEIIVILGGVHATIRPDWHFEESAPDFIVLGEGEQTIVQLLTELAQDTPNVESVCGIAFRNSQGKIEKTPPRDRQVQLDWAWSYQRILLKPNGESRYIDKFCRKHPVYADSTIGEDVPSFAFYSSRGCRTKCHYCPASQKEGRIIRHMGAERAFTQFKTVRENYSVGVFANQSDAFCVSIEDKRFLKMVTDYRLSSGDNKFALNNPNAFFLHLFFPPEQDYNLDVDFLDLLVSAGFNTVTIAVETLIPRYNRKVNWNRIRPEQVIELCQVIRDKGLKSDIYMMYGFPEQTEEEFARDVTFGEALRVYADFVTWNGLTLLPDTRYYHDYIERQSGGEKKYRQTMRSGHAWHYPLDLFNFSHVPTSVFSEKIKPFGQSWI